MKRWFLAILILAGIAAGAYAFYGVRRDSGNAATSTATGTSAPAVAVTVALAARKPMPVQVETIGRVQTVASVAVKSRIDGVIAAVPVADGQEVKAGQVLFRLDDRQALAQLHQAQANLSRDRAQLENARRDLDRLTPLQEKGFTSRQTYDTARTNVAMLDAAVKGTEAQIENLQVALSYTVIAAPIDGRLGTIAAKTGNNVKANDAALVTINQIKPIYVSFTVTQTDLAELRAAVAKGPVGVAVIRQGANLPPLMGEVAYFDNAVDPQSNTVTVRASVANEDSALWPGQYVNVLVTLRTEPEAVVVPNEALQAGQNGPYLYVVGKANMAELRQVKVARSIGGETVLETGVQPGEAVVTSGQMRVTNGMTVAPRTATAAAGARSEAQSN